MLSGILWPFNKTHASRVHLRFLCCIHRGLYNECVMFIVSSPGTWDVMFLDKCMVRSAFLARIVGPECYTPFHELRAALGKATSGIEAWTQVHVRASSVFIRARDVCSLQGEAHGAPWDYFFSRGVIDACLHLAAPTSCWIELKRRVDFYCHNNRTSRFTNRIFYHTLRRYVYSEILCSFLWLWPSLVKEKSYKEFNTMTPSDHAS